MFVVLIVNGSVIPGLSVAHEANDSFRVKVLVAVFVVVVTVVVMGVTYSKDEDFRGFFVASELGKRSTLLYRSPR